MVRSGRGRLGFVTNMELPRVSNFPLLGVCRGLRVVEDTFTPDVRYFWGSGSRRGFYDTGTRDWKDRQEGVPTTLPEVGTGTGVQSVRKTEREKGGGAVRVRVGLRTGQGYR